MCIAQRLVVLMVGKFFYPRLCKIIITFIVKHTTRCVRGMCSQIAVNILYFVNIKTLIAKLVTKAYLLQALK